MPALKSQTVCTTSMYLSNNCNFRLLGEENFLKCCSKVDLPSCCWRPGRNYCSIHTYYLCAFENQLFLVSIVIRPLTENYNHFSDADEKFNDRDISSPPPPSLTRRKSVFDRLKHFIAIGSESIEDTESDGRG